MKSPKNTTLYSRLALITSVTLVVGYFVVYAWTTIDPARYAGGATLTSTLMTDIMANITDLNTRVSNFSFNGGNVGLGIINPTTKLHIDGGILKISNSTVNSASIEMRGGLDGGNSSSIYIRSSTGGYNTMLSDGTYNNYIGVLGGYVGIGTVSPAQKLDVVGNIKTSGCLYYASSSLGTCASDEQIKKDITPFNLGLDTILGLQPKHFKYNGLGGLQDDGIEQIGVIAQDVEKIAPSLIKKQRVQLHPNDQKQTEIKAVDYGSFTYLLINAVKELKLQKDSEIQQLKQKNLDLETQIKLISERLNKLENK